MYCHFFILLSLIAPYITEKITSQAFNQSHHNHRTGPATNIPWSVLFDPNFSGVVKVEGSSLKTTTPSTVSIFYGQNIYSPSSYGQSSGSKKKTSYSIRIPSTTTKSPTSTSAPASGPVVVAYSSPDHHAEPSNTYPSPAHINHRPIYPEEEHPSVYPEEKDAQLFKSKAESRIQAPAYIENSYSRPYYSEYADEEDKRPVYRETPYRKKSKPYNDRRPPEYYKKSKPTFSESAVEISDDPFEPLPDPFDEGVVTKTTPGSYSKKKKGHQKKPERYFTHYLNDKDEFSSESKHHPFYTYDYYGDYYEGAGIPIAIKHRLYSKKKSKYGPLAFALGLLPLGLMLAAIVPGVMTIPATVTTTAGRKRRSILEQEYTNPVLDVIAKYGVQNLDDPLCMQRIFCQVTTEGKGDSANFLLKVFYKLAKLLDEDWMERFGLKLLLRAIKRDQCDAFPCPSSPASKKKS